MLEQLQDLGLRHVEIAWSSDRLWIPQCRELLKAFPVLRLGAASISSAAGVADASAAGFGYGVAPVLQRSLLQGASAAGLTLIPGVMTPTEVHRARRWGASIVKLFPASTLGPHYWRRLGDPLGAPLPFCIAAGGLGPADVLPWLEAGTDAVALGSSLLGGKAGCFDPSPLRGLLGAMAAGGMGV